MNKKEFLMCILVGTIIAILLFSVYLDTHERWVYGECGEFKNYAVKDLPARCLYIYQNKE